MQNHLCADVLSTIFFQSITSIFLKYLWVGYVILLFKTDRYEK